MIISVIRNPKNRFVVARCHYSLDPEKNTPAWIAEAKRGMPEAGWNREYEIDYSYFAGKPFFPEFKEWNIGEISYSSREVLYRGWDYGFHRPCCLVTSLNSFDQWKWIKVILGKDEGILDFGKRVREYCFSTYPGAKYVDADDIAGTQVSDKSQQTSRQLLNSLGIFPIGRKQEIAEGASIIRNKLAMRVDGKPGLIVNGQETDLIDLFRGGIHYPEAKEGREEREAYEKDGYFDHIVDCARYIGTQMFSVVGNKQSNNEIAYNPMEEMYRDGRPRNSLDENEVTSQSGFGEIIREFDNEIIDL
ncbi:MAG TPA: hypothetical protein ACFYD4_06200 [Candidatus Wunengus sp. YC61]|uniref:hypothetical protein n=1 Tax=Candidatus Wunengus sp. YC61 TaxID=3367698 RepID=UPI004025ACB5